MKRNGWQISIELFYECSDKENRNVLSSPLFDSEEKADKWYQDLDFSFTDKDYAEHMDIIMIHYVNDIIEDSYIL